MIKQVRWLRVVIAAFLIEVGLTVTTVPFLLLIGEQVLMTAVPVACVVVPFVIAWLATRKLPGARVVHGLLIGIVATVMYFALVIGASSIAEASGGVRLADVLRRQRAARGQRRSRRLRRRPARGTERRVTRRREVTLRQRAARPRSGSEAATTETP